MDCSSITDFQQSTAIRIAKKFRNLHIGKCKNITDISVPCIAMSSSHRSLAMSRGMSREMSGEMSE